MGVKTFDESSIKISDYRHLLEWNPIHKTMKLTRLKINSGQTYARDSSVVFNLSYNQENPCIRFITPNHCPDKKTKKQWIEYLNSIDIDPKIKREVTDLINQECPF
ncbi:hypothetical protein D3C75_1176960 [compost metagenome]